MVRSFDIAFSHFSFYVADHEEGYGARKGIDAGQIWEFEEEDDRYLPVVASIPNFPELFSVRTLRHVGIVRVELDVVDTPRATSPGDEWIKAGDVVFHTPSGKVVISGPEDPHGEEEGSVIVPVTPGHYDGAVFYTGKDQIDDEFEWTGPDRYRIVLWPLRNP